MRHAKSSWKDDSLEDKDRRLKGRGKKAATDVGARLGRKSYIPQLVIVSDAVRARQTWEHCWQGMKSFDTEQDMVNPRLIIAPSLYDPANVPGYLKPLLDNVDKDEIVQIVAHWPGVEDFIRYLVYNPSNDVLDAKNERGKIGDREYMQDEGGEVPEMKTSFACILKSKAKDWKSALKGGGWTVDRVITPSEEFRGKGHLTGQIELGLPTYYQGSESQDEGVSVSESWVDPDNE